MALTPEQQKIMDARVALLPPEVQARWAEMKASPVGESLTGATIEPASTFESPIRIPDPMPGVPYGPTAGIPDEGIDTGVSPEELTEFLPGAGGALGAILGLGAGSPVLGGSLGSAGGEAIRQLIRRSMDKPAATGMGQEMAGLDPDSTQAALLSLLMEGSAGAAGEALPMLRGAGSRLHPGGAREAALRNTVEGLADTAEMGEKVIKKMMDDLRPVEGNLPKPGFNPLTTRKRAVRHFEGEADVAGKKVDEIFADDAVTSPQRVRKELLQEALDEKRTMTPEFDYPDPKRPGKTLHSPETYVGDTAKAEVQAIRARATKLQTKIKAKDILQEDFTATDMHKMRKAAAADAKRASAKAFSLLPDSPIPPKAIGALEERRLLSEELHRRVPGSKEVEAIYSAYKAGQGLAATGGQSHFLQRWAVSRIIGGTLGTTVGAVAQTPLFWRLLKAKGYRGLAQALETGGEVQAEQWLRGFAANMGDEE